MNITRIISISIGVFLTAGVFHLSVRQQMGELAMADEPTQAVTKALGQTDTGAGAKQGTRVATYVGRQQCAECHRENFEQHAAHGHASTFAEIAQTNLPDIFDQQTFDGGEGYGTYQYSKDKSGHVTVSLPTSENPSEIPLQYVLGSGHNARTILTLNRTADGLTEGIEHRVSCYPDQRLGMTVGHGEKKPARDLEKFGDVTSGEITQRCVYCHTTTGILTEGRIDRLVSNVNCEKCHGPGSEHVRQARELRNPPPYSVGAADWDAESEIQLCGDCHRLPRSITKQELRDYPETLARFQPVGMLRSKCYLASNREMKCSTCHDPHQSVHGISQQKHEQKCIQCHDTSDSSHTICPVSAEANCIECHMPTVPQEQGIKFHDHWIRIHKD
ncbi:MAG: cytochrome C [Rubripirellula sp.]|nr:cytochrome C [Rhodopirellula sp.]MCH1440183.1 cytochrome C [Rubripirellula sp.]OUX04780.1 MAG: cytochrome C [Planctomycetaceae bacterium TMED240]